MFFLDGIFNWVHGLESSQVTLFATVIVGLGVLISLFRKPDTSRLTNEIDGLKVALTGKETELRDALTRADRSESLTFERREEIDRLNGDLSKLRSRMDQNTEAHRILTGQVESLRAKELSDQSILAERKSEIQRLGEDAKDLRVRVEAEQLAHQTLKARISSLETQIDGERVAAIEKIELLSKIRDDMQERFRQLADEALRTQGDAFSKANIQKLEATLTPLKEHVGHFEKELREVHQETVKDRERLKVEITQLTARSEAISLEAVALTRALKGDRQQQGAWGEMILESILERSGLREGEEYHTQAHRTGTEGERLRPDVVVNMPGGKSLVIDSKVSLNDYVAAVNAENDTAATVSRKRHVVALRNHIKGLSEKGYQRAENSTVDYVIMFVPIEGALSEALREDGTLTQYALDLNIMIATPTILMMALRTASHVWAVERRNLNAEAIANRAGLLYDKIAGFLVNMDKVGKTLEQASLAYNSAHSQLSRGRGNVLAQVETLKNMGAKATKSITIDFDADDALGGVLENDLEAAEEIRTVV